MVWKVCIAALGAITFVVTAGPALAAPVEEEFARICLPAKTAAEATARARAAGYLTAPSQIAAKLKGFPDNGEVLWRTGEGEMSVFIAASITRRMKIQPSQAVKGDVCVVASMPSQPELQTKLERLLDVGRAQPFGNDSAYIFDLTDEGPVRLDGSDRGLVMVKVVQGSARMAVAMERREMSGLVLMIPAIAPE